MKLRIVFLMLVSLSLVACRAGLQLGTGHTLFHVLPGSEFILHADIIIPPGQLRASFQGGKLSRGASEFEPRCELELRNFSEEPQTIHAGTYTIKSVLGQDRYVLHPDEKILVASVGVLQLAFGGGDSQWYMNAYHMKLHSGVHKHAPDLICGGEYNYAFYVHYPSFQEILVALGDYAELKLR